MNVRGIRGKKNWWVKKRKGKAKTETIRGQ